VIPKYRAASPPIFLQLGDRVLGFKYWGTKWRQILGHEMASNTGVRDQVHREAQHLSHGDQVHVSCVGCDE
jgi:hypothetical protein